MDKKAWEKTRAEVETTFKEIFGDKAPLVELQYHEGDYADNDITIDGHISLYPVEVQLPFIGGHRTSDAWQLAECWYDPGNRNQPPDGGVNDIGEPHRALADALREAVMLYAQHAIDMYHEHLADEEQAKFDEEYEQLFKNDFEMLPKP